MSNDLERLQYLAASGDPAALDALEREARRRGDTAAERLARVRQIACSTEVPWAVLKDRLNALNDPDPEVRALAVEEIAALPLDAAAMWPPLQEALRDPAPEVRIAAAFAVRWLDLCADVSDPVREALCACLRDLDPDVRDQAAASLVAHTSIHAEARDNLWHMIHAACTTDYLTAYPPTEAPLTPDPVLPDTPRMEAQWSDEVTQMPSHDPSLPLGWACVVAGAVASSATLFQTHDPSRALLARQAPLTALALVVESHFRSCFYPRTWDSLSGFIMVHHEGKPSGALLARMRGMLASSRAQERASAAMAWSELIVASRTIHTHDLQAMGTVCGLHFDPAVRRNSLPGRLLRAGLRDAKFSIFEEALRDPDPQVRAFALALLCGTWDGPSANGGCGWPPYHNTLDRLGPPRIFYRIWTLNAVAEDGCWGLASVGARDESCAVRYEALVLIAKLCERTPHKTLYTAFQNVLRTAYARDPDEGLRDMAHWLCNWLKIS